MKKKVCGKIGIVHNKPRIRRIEGELQEGTTAAQCHAARRIAHIMTDRHILLGLIDEHVNTLAMQICERKPDAFEVFKNAPLLHRVGFIGLVAEVSGEMKIAENCDAWMKIIEA